MIKEELGHGAGHEDQSTDLAAGIGRDSYFYILMILYTNFNVVKQFLDDYEDNPDEDFGDNEMNATKSRKYVSAREYYAFKTAGLEEAF